MKRFKYAYSGFLQMFRKDYHFLIHVLIALVVVLSGIFFSFHVVEWLFIVSAIFAVLLTEVINTSIEYVVDLVTEEYRELAKFAKDISAFSVALASIYALIVGLTIFLPAIINELI